jgi:hypothetical protein
MFAEAAKATGDRLPLRALAGFDERHFDTLILQS